MWWQYAGAAVLVAAAGVPVVVAGATLAACVGLGQPGSPPSGRAAGAVPAGARSSVGPSVIPSGAPPARPEEEAPRAARKAGPPSPYPLGNLSVFSKALFYVRENYLDKQRFVPQKALIGALEAVQRQIPEIMVEGDLDGAPRSLTLRVNGAMRAFAVDRVDAPWSLRSKLQEMFRFVEENLAPLPADDAKKRGLDIELAATNGFLLTLDRMSMLIDAQQYGEMRNTRARAGVGLTIRQVPTGPLHITRVLKDGPAAEAGIVAGDLLVRIDGEPTATMNVEDAFSRVRGEGGSQVELVVQHAGEKRAKTLRLQRSSTMPAGSVEAPFRVWSVPETPAASSAQAPRKIGYIHLAHFAYDAATQVQQALWGFEKEKVHGIILDLRDNSGGLYAQAAKVVDLFVKQGNMVTMVGVKGTTPIKKDETASDDGTEPATALAVLVNHASAAASEIVAAALRDLDRAVIIGQTTFGSGSVQVLFDIQAPVKSADATDPGDRLGLKLTTAQWLTPAGASLQRVGIAPDIEVVPVRVGKSSVGTPFLWDQEHRPKWRKAADEDEQLPNWSGPTSAPRPLESVPYLDAAPPQEQRDLDAKGLAAMESEEPPAAETDFEVRLARDLLAESTALKRTELLAGAKPVLRRLRAGEGDKLVGALAKLGVDWRSELPTAVVGRAELKLAVVGGERPVATGDVLRIKQTVTNKGTTKLTRLRVTFEGTSSLLDSQSAVVGVLAPGQSRTVEWAVRVPPGTLAFTDVVAAKLTSSVPLESNRAEATMNVAGGPRPRFACQYKVAGGDRGDQKSASGKIRRKLVLEIRNVGKGPAKALEATLRARYQTDALSVVAGRFVIGGLEPGARVTAPFEYEIDGEAKQVGSDFDLQVFDEAFGEMLADRVHGESSSSGGFAGPVLVATAPTAVDSAQVHLAGTADDPDGVRDVYVLVENRPARKSLRKIFYQRAPEGQTHLAFETDVPLWPGGNLVRVFARDAREVVSETELRVFRR